MSLLRDRRLFRDRAAGYRYNKNSTGTRNEIRNLNKYLRHKFFIRTGSYKTSVGDPDPQDPYYMFLCLLDPDPDPIVRGTDSGSFYHQANIERKALIPTVLRLTTFYLRNDVNVHSKSNKQKNNNFFLLAS